MSEKARVKFKIVKNNLENLNIDTTLGVFSISDKFIYIGLGENNFIKISSDIINKEKFIDKNDSEFFATKEELNDKVDRTMILEKTELIELLSNKVDLSDFRNILDEIENNKLNMIKLNGKIGEFDLLKNSFDSSNNDSIVKLLNKLMSIIDDNKNSVSSLLSTKADNNIIGNINVSGFNGSNIGNQLADAKRRIDAINISDYYNKSEINEKLNNKLNSSEISNYYRKSEVFNKNELNMLLSNKVDSSVIGTLGNTGLTGNTVTELLTDAKNRIDAIDISNYYNRTETDNLISSYTENHLNSKIGLLNNLNTSDKNNIVSAINELKSNEIKVLPSGSTPDTTNIPTMKVAYILKP